ncbi:PRC-barrel domain-containing protein [Brucella sp. BO2]|uniref:PRC-barrel domain-containing protein n=1 Tax=Brucella sp. BO2 TaxID=693750 RepID=UPI0001E4474E|nr:PRC-barrel domain-containing protein [Brucella sp. BO2]EFM59919.1 PRC-barrel domain-containing protein [Brucella sp. BO2]QPN28781.1 PRC-barrel domain-containing protein [Brucella sp. BO2]
MKRLLATTALAAMVALPAFAQGGTPIFTGEKQHQPVTSKNGYFVASPGQLLTSDFIGQPVYNGPSDDADNIGTVNDIILGADGTPQAMVIGVGGFLGVGEKDVAIGCNHFSWIDKSGGTRWLMVDADKEQLEKAPVFDRNAAFTANGASRAAEKTVTTKKTSRVIPEGMKPIANEGLSAEKLIGAMVYDADETKIGTIGDVLMSADGQTEAFVVDVGGFLGINSKPVAISIANLDVATGKDGKLSVFTQFTKKDLQAQPAFSETAYKEDPEGAILHGTAE